MEKYILVAKNTWEETLSYRLNFVMWRVRVFLQLITIYFLWFSLLPTQGSIFGYSKNLMLTYIFGTSILSSIVIASRSGEIGDQIHQGQLSNFLLRPINYFYYLFARDIGDKAMNILFSIFELTALFIFIHPPIFLQTNIFFLVAFFLSLIFALLLNFFFNMLLGCVGFWSGEVWAPRFIFSILLTFFAGGLFPLDILPKPLFTLFYFSPFPYLLYFPLKIYLGAFNTTALQNGFIISILWTFILYVIVLFVWKKGLKVYAAEGQ